MHARLGFSRPRRPDLTRRGGFRLAKTLRNSKSSSSLTAETIVADYRLAYSSRRASIIGRAEVLRGNATFGIFGDGKEVPQLAMASCGTSLPSPKMPNVALPRSTSALPMMLARRLL